MFLEVHDMDNNEVLINIKTISTIQKWDDCSYINFECGRQLSVKEPYSLLKEVIESRDVAENLIVCEYSKTLGWYLKYF